MKYSDQNPPLVCMMTQSTCYKGTSTGTPVGVLWHDTAGGNPNLKRYVQPDDNASNRAELLEKLGKNVNNNDFNHIVRYAGLNCWIGKLANGEITTVQTMPWNYRPWGCGSGSKGSCNGTKDGPFWIQFEICDDAYDATAKEYSKGTKDYFDKVYKEACEITAYLCKKFNINPKSTIVYKGVSVPTILCHNDSHKLGLGSGHKDVLQWFSKYNKTMNDVRNDVEQLLKTDAQPVDPSLPTPSPEPTPNVTLTIGDLISIKDGATYYSGKSVPAWVIQKKWYITSINNDRVVLGKSEDGTANLTSAFFAKDLIKVNNELPQEPTFTPYVVRITAAALNVRQGPSMNYSVNMVIYKGGTYTIVEEKNGWGKLKSGVGWINLQYTEKK